MKDTNTVQPDSSGLQHDPKPEQPDHSGLQYVHEQDAPEVVPDSNRNASVDRHSSMNSPEVNKQKKYEYYAGDTQGHDEVKGYYGEHYAGEAEKYTSEEPKEKRVFGLRRKVFFWILAVVILLVVIAAVLGGVLGSLPGGSKSNSNNTAPKPDAGPPSNNSTSNNSSSAPSTIDLSGLATIQPAGDSVLYQYYQDTSGRILENQYASGQWSIQDDNVPDDAVVISSAMSRTPIVATSWANNGAIFRQVFYIDENGLVLTTNTTGTNPWPTPYNCLPTDSAAPDSIALAVVSDTNVNALNGIRLYYASSSSGNIQEVGIDFGVTDTPGWNQWVQFGGSDATYGVATVLSGTVNHVYLVNSTTGALQQWTWDYADVTTWVMGARATTADIEPGSDIAAVNDGHSNDYIFYQDPNNHLIRSLYFGSSLGSALDLGAVADKTKLAAVYDDTSTSSNAGAVVYYQHNNDSSVGFQQVNRAGEVLDSGTVG